MHPRDKIKRYCYNDKGKTHNANLIVVNSYASENTVTYYGKKGKVKTTVKGDIDRNLYVESLI